MTNLNGLSLFNRVVIQNRKKDKKIKKKASKIQELTKLLEQHPVQVVVDADGIRLDEPEGWALENWEIARRISEVVFLEPETSAWLESLRQEQEQEQMKMAA
jgi:hypothetical protein